MRDKNIRFFCLSIASLMLLSYGKDIVLASDFDFLMRSEGQTRRGFGLRPMVINIDEYENGVPRPGSEDFIPPLSYPYLIEYENFLRPYDQDLSWFIPECESLSLSESSEDPQIDPRAEEIRSQLARMSKVSLNPFTPRKQSLSLSESLENPQIDPRAEEIRSQLARMSKVSLNPFTPSEPTSSYQKNGLNSSKERLKRLVRSLKNPNANKDEIITKICEILNLYSESDYERKEKYIDILEALINYVTSSTPSSPAVSEAFIAIFKILDKGKIYDYSNVRQSKIGICELISCADNSEMLFLSRINAISLALTILGEGNPCDYDNIAKDDIGRYALVTYAKISQDPLDKKINALNAAFKALWKGNPCDYDNIAKDDIGRYALVTYAKISQDPLDKKINALNAAFKALWKGNPCDYDNIAKDDIGRYALVTYAKISQGTLDKKINALNAVFKALGEGDILNYDQIVKDRQGQFALAEYVKIPCENLENRMRAVKAIFYGLCNKDRINCIDEIAKDREGKNVIIACINAPYASSNLRKNLTEGLLRAKGIFAIQQMQSISELRKIFQYDEDDMEIQILSSYLSVPRFSEESLKVAAKLLFEKFSDSVEEILKHKFGIDALISYAKSVKLNQEERKLKIEELLRILSNGEEIDYKAVVRSERGLEILLCYSNIPSIGFDNQIKIWKSILLYLHEESGSLDVPEEVREKSMLELIKCLNINKIIENEQGLRVIFLYANCARTSLEETEAIYEYMLKIVGNENEYDYNCMAKNPIGLNVLIFYIKNFHVNIGKRADMIEALYKINKNPDFKDFIISMAIEVLGSKNVDSLTDAQKDKLNRIKDDNFE